jgi:hypothetical protein
MLAPVGMHLFTLRIPHWAAFVFLMLQGQRRCAMTCIGERQIPMTGTAEGAEDAEELLWTTANGGAVLRDLRDLRHLRGDRVLFDADPATRRHVPPGQPRSQKRRIRPFDSCKSRLESFAVGAGLICQGRGRLTGRREPHRPHGAIRVIRPLPGNP